MIIKTYHYLYYCYYNLVSSKTDHREDGASSALTIFDSSMIIAIYIYFNILFERKTFTPTVEGFGIFFLGVLLGILNWIYFVRKKKYLEAVNDFKDVPKYITVSIGIFLLIFPLALFIFSGIKMGNYIRSIH
jgi:hypothetical protein